MTARESERLGKVEQKQDDFNERLKNVEDKLDILISKFDNLSGGKQALMWVTGTMLTISALVLGIVHEFRKQ